MLATAIRRRRKRRITPHDRVAGEVPELSAAGDGAIAYGLDIRDRGRGRAIACARLARQQFRRRWRSRLLGRLCVCAGDRCHTTGSGMCRGGQLTCVATLAAAIDRRIVDLRALTRTCGAGGERCDGFSVSHRPMDGGTGRQAKTINSKAFFLIFSLSTFIQEKLSQLSLHNRQTGPSRCAVEKTWMATVRGETSADRRQSFA